MEQSPHKKKTSAVERDIGIHARRFILLQSPPQHTNPHPPHAHVPHVHVHSGPLVSFTSDQVSCLRCDHKTRY
jgi:hypothetical protein